MNNTIKIISFFIILSLGSYLLYYTISESNKQNLPNNNDQFADDTISTNPISYRKDPDGASKHKIYSATSDDGLLWIKNAKMLIDQATSPKAIYKNGIIYLYYTDGSDSKTDRLFVAISSDLGQSFATKEVKIKSFESFDVAEPEPIIIDNKIRLYFRGEIISKKMYPNSKYKIFYATSEDGINFDLPNLVYENKTPSTYPDIYYYKNQMNMFLTNVNELNLTNSPNLGLSFTIDPNFSFNHAKYSDTINQAGILRTYYCDTSIKSAIGAEDKKLIPEPGIRLSEEGKIVCHPSIIKISDSQYLMFYTINN